jgi:hypothetical protein
MSSFNNAGLGGGPFSGGNADGLKGGIHAAMKVMQQNANQHDHMPTEATPEIIDAAAKEASTAMTIHDKNKIINTHYKNMGVDSDKQNTQSIAAFERAVMKRLGR